jgi:hypothetical protein
MIQIDVPLITVDHFELDGKSSEDEVTSTYTLFPLRGGGAKLMTKLYYQSLT